MPRDTTMTVARALEQRSARAGTALRWFTWMLPLFVIGLVGGLLFALIGMLTFVRVLGLVASIGSVMGIAVCLVGRDDARDQLGARDAFVPAPAEPRFEPTLAAVDAASAQPDADVASTAERLPTWPGVAQPV